MVLLKNTFARTLLLVLLLQPLASAFAAELKDIGSFNFPTSASPAAQEQFLLGVGYLHSFGWTQAQQAFLKAQEIEPDFALAYWGESFTYNHPFIAEWDSESPRRALQKLAPTIEGQLAKAPTEREKAFLRVAQAYAYTPGDISTRRLAQMQAMREAYAAFPDDREVTAFYAVALLTGAAATNDADERDRLNMQAGALALELFRENENHPGAAHYIIHAFDDPVHAPLALVAAKKYASIAPAVSHARHMPTHIFIQHGMWQEVSDWNESSFQAGADLWQPGDRPNDMNHSSDWGQYGDLQLGDYARARRWIDKAQQVQQDNPDDARSANTVKEVEARYIIETRQWQLAPITAQTSAAELLAIGMSAANLGDFPLAQQAADRLAQMAQAQPNNTVLKIAQLEVAALTELRQAQAASTPPVKEKVTSALARLAEGVRLAETMRPPNGAANPHKPVYELYGELLLEVGRPDEAMAQFRQSLLRMPNRPLSVLGLARSHAAKADQAAAAEQYRQLLSVWGQRDFAETREAREYLGSL
ncbi:MAG: hypothetical protein RQ757_09080 [Pseudomonadales bacterium]|nr:hypothetical protein [Pseudomonadales bacterium]